MSENMKLWDALCKTDPSHTKAFNRSGGFKGTAIKPIWIVRRLTEQFGPVGEGWGMGEPSFQVIHAGEEILVYCTVRCWHTTPENGFHGVGGDKVLAKFTSGLKTDDEAFKKAFTDAVGNAFKFVGIGADVHMGQFDDSKYVQAMEREFSKEEPKAKAPAHSALKTQVREFVGHMEGCGDWDEWIAFRETKESQALLKEVRENLPSWWDGGPDMPDEFVPLRRRIELLEANFANNIADIARA